MGSALIATSPTYPSRCPRPSRPSRAALCAGGTFQGLLCIRQSRGAQPSSWCLETPIIHPKALPGPSPAPSPPPPTSHLHRRTYTRRTAGPTDLCLASLTPRQESWGLTHWLGDSQGSHLRAFVCVRDGTAMAMPPPPAPLQAHPQAHCPAHTQQLWALLPGPGQPGHSGKRHTLPPALLPRPRTFPSPSSPSKDLLRLSLGNPRPTEDLPPVTTVGHLGFLSLSYLLFGPRRSPASAFYSNI